MSGCLKKIEKIVDGKTKMVACGEPVFPGANYCAEHEIERLRESEKAWKDACHSREASLGFWAWRRYYEGAKAERNGSLYDPEYGRNFHNYDG